MKGSTPPSGHYPDATCTVYVPKGAKATYLNSWWGNTNIIEENPVEKVIIDNHEIVLDKGEQRMLVASVNPTDADDKIIKWLSQTPSVASVDDDGIVTAIASGQTHVYATSLATGIKDSCLVIVRKNVTGVEFETPSIYLTSIGDSKQLAVKISPEDATEQAVTYKSLNESVCHVSDKGLVIAVDYGTAAVTATTVDGGHTAVCTVKVVHDVETVEIETHELTIKAKDTKQLKVKVLPDNAYDKTVTWTSSNDSLATVDADGNVKALAVGEAFIKATSSVNAEAADSCRVNIIQRIEVTDSTIVWNDTTFIYSGLSPQLTWKNNKEEYKVEATIPKLEKNVGRWGTTVPFTFTDGVDTLVVSYPLYYTIIPAGLTIKANDAERYYRDENPEFTFTYDGFVNDETEDVLTQKPVATTTATVSSPVGTYPIMVEKAEANNYTIEYIEGTLTIKERIVLKDSAIVWNDTVFVYTGLSPQPTWENTQSEYTVTAEMPQLEKNVGCWETIVPFSFTDNVDTLTIDVPLHYTIKPATLTVKAEDAERYEGEENPEFTFTYEGFVNDETEEVLTQKPVATTTATAESPIGTYPITVEGAEADNYTIEYVEGTLTIKEKTVEGDDDVTDIITASDVTMKAGDNTTLTVCLTTKDTDYNGYQFNLYLPEGISVATDENGNYLVTEKTGREKVALGVSDGSVLFYTTADKNHDALVGGPLMEIELTADSVLDAGNYTIRIERVVCATRENKSVSLPSSTVTVTVEKETEPEVPAIVTAEDVEGQPAGQITLPVFLNNATDINAFYFDLTLPKGITVAEDENRNILASLVGDYADGKMLLTVQPWDASMGTTNNVNTWRFIATPMYESVFSANAGHVLNITLHVDEDMASGVYTARMNVVNLIEANENAAGSRADSGRFQVLRSPAAASWTSYSSITIKTTEMGDANGDGVVDVADVVAIVNYILEKPAQYFNKTAADVNGDEVIDAADVVLVVNIILDKDSVDASRVRAVLRANGFIF